MIRILYFVSNNIINIVFSIINISRNYKTKLILIFLLFFLNKFFYIFVNIQEKYNF